MNKFELKLIILIFLITLIAGCRYQKEAAQSKIINTYNILAGHTLNSENTPLNRKKLLPDRNVPGELSGVFNALIISEHVDEKTPLYKIISELKIDGSIKKKLLKNITDGVLKIYFDLGAPWGTWKNNYKAFERELQQTGLKILNNPPDFIVISHAHWPNYIGGIEFFQKKYPYIPVFITPDMKEGLVCFDYDKEGASIDQKHTNGRIVKIKNPIVLPPGITVLTKHLSILTQNFRHKCPTIAFKNGKISIGIYKKNPEYENILILNTKKGLALFTTCIHSSLLEAIKKTMGLYNKKVYLYCGGFEENPNTLIEAKKISPSLKFLLYHCAPVEKLISKFGNSFIKRVHLGESIFLEF